MKGRKPLPTPLKLLSGVRPDRINDREPTGLVGRPEAPDYLDETAQAKWDEMIEVTGRMGTLTLAEGEALALYCQAFSRKRLAEDSLAAYGVTVCTESGSVKSNPALRVIEACESIMLRIIAEFGMTPSSKSKVQVRDDGPKDALAEFLARRKV